jgi:hypothetical protein
MNGPRVTPYPGETPWSNPVQTPYGPQPFRPAGASGARLTPGGALPGNGGAFPIAGGAEGGGLEVFSRYPFATLRGSVRIAVSNAAPGTLAVAAPPTFRNFLGLRNASATANVYVEFGNEASLNSFVRLAPDEIILFDAAVPQDDVFTFADDVNAFLIVAQSVFTITEPAGP